MYAKNERERAMYEYGYLKGMAEAFERMLIKENSIIGMSEYTKSRTINIDDRRN